jgi:peptidoglycan hydrolase-like protein with peptidoglycan-binding domain
MRIAISSGHSKYCRGASDIVDEVDEARKIVNRVAELLSAAGVGVEVFHDNVSTTQSENLDRIVDWHNSQIRDRDASVHLNAYEHTSKPMGTECLYVTQSELAADVAAEIAISTGLIDRGPKYRSDLAFLNGTDKPAVLIETLFCDSQADVDIYHQHFEDMCRAIAETIGDVMIGVEPPPLPSEPPEEPERPQRPHWPDRPQSIPVEDRPTLRQGDEGPHVLDMQRMIPRFSGGFDGDFGPTTEDNVVRYQRTRGLLADGICGQHTWGALYDHKLPVPPPPLPPGALTAEQQLAIMKIANESRIADYSWPDRGVAPTGFTQGMALSFAQTYKKLKANHPAALEMAKARTNSDKDVLNLWRDEFDDLGMSNERAGIDTLRHLHAFMLGSGMRESSGQHCCGRDQSASNYDSTTCEAGAFQTSYNASSASNPKFDNLMDEYLEGLSPGYLEAWSEGVSCSADDWENYGSGRGEDFQALCKNAPAFSAESHGLTLRNLCNHYGPVIRFEVTLTKDADVMFRAVQDYVDESEPETA